LLLPPLNPACPLSRGLVFAMLGSATGTYRAQDSARGNHGTLMNMDPATDWVFDAELGRKGLDYGGGSSEHVLVATPFVVAAPITMACWFITDTNTSDAGMINIVNASTEQCFTMYRNDSPAAVRAFTRAGGTAYATSPSGITVGKLHHAAVVFATPSYRVAYLDGVAGAPNTTSQTPSGIDTATVGCQHWAGAMADFFNGRIIDPMVWNRALSAHEIAALANPSNVMLEVGGQPLIEVPSFKTYFYGALGGAPPATFKPYWIPQRSRVLGVSA